MNKTQISLSELAHRIVLEKKFNKMIAEIEAMMKATTQILNENIPSGIDQSILQVSKNLDAAGENVENEDVQAALLIAAIKKGGDPSKVTPEEVESLMPTVQEKRQKLNESGAVLQIVETISLVLGNAALIEAICKAITKATGKATDPSKFTQKMRDISVKIKQVVGWPMKKLGQAIEWIIAKIGGGKDAQKIGKYSIKLTLVLVLFAIGALFFPIGGATIFGIVISVTAMIGKGFEIVELTKELIAAIKTAAADAKGGNPAPALA